METRMSVPEIRNMVSSPQDASSSPSGATNKFPTPEDFFRTGDVQKGVRETSAESIASKLISVFRTNSKMIILENLEDKIKELGSGGERKKNVRAYSLIIS